MRALPVLSLLLAAGCAFYDGRGRFDIEPAGELVGCTFVRLRVVASNVDGAFISIDGGPEVRYPANTAVSLLLAVRPDPVPGEPLRFRVRARSEGGFSQSVERSGVIDCTSPPVDAPRLIAVDPPAGPVDGTVPLQVRLTFSKALQPAGVTPGRFAVEPAVFGGAVPAVRSAVLEPDGKTVRLTIEPPLGQVGPVSIFGQVADLLGPPWVDVRVGPYEVPVIRPTWLAPAEGSATSARVSVSVGGTGTGPVNLELGSVPVAAPATPPFTVEVDTRPFSEGAHRLSLRAPPGSLLLGNAPGPTIVVDRTAPRVTECYPPAPAGLPPEFFFFVLLDEPVVGAAPRLLVNGTPAGQAVRQDASTFVFTATGVTPPASVVPELGGARDAAGNAVGPFTCGFDVPVWRRPWGAGPFADSAGDPWKVAAAGLRYNGTTGADVVWSSAGKVSWGAVTPGGVLDPLRAPIAADPAAVAEGLVVHEGVAAWIERAGAADSRVHAWSVGAENWLLGSSAPLNADTTRGPGELAVASSRSAGVAWTEHGPTGGRRIAGRLSLGMTSAPIDDLRADPAAVAGQPALGVVPDGQYTTMARLAWIESGPGAPRLRVATGSFDELTGTGSWSEEAGPWTTATSPAEPSLVERSGADGVLTWRDGDLALASVWTLSGGYGPATVLNTASGRVARLVQANGGYNGGGLSACFVEAGDAGDEIWCRTWDGAGWVLVQVPANAGVPGRVSALQVETTGLIVTWLDDQGQIRSRMLNR